MTIFINGKQKRVKRPPTINGTDVNEFIYRNADPIWLHQNEMWEYMTIDEEPYKSPQPSVPDRSARRFSDDGDRGALPDEDGER